MNEIERLLHEPRRVEPDANLDRAMECMFFDAVHKQPAWYRRPVPLWQAAVASFVLALAVFAFTRPGEGIRETIYVIQSAPGPQSSIFSTTAEFQQLSPRRSNPRCFVWDGQWEERTRQGGDV